MTVCVELGKQYTFVAVSISMNDLYTTAGHQQEDLIYSYAGNHNKQSHTITGLITK